MSCTASNGETWGLTSRSTRTLLGGAARRLSSRRLASFVRPTPMSRICPACEKKISIGDLQREFACPFCGTLLKSNSFFIVAVALFIGSLPGFAFLDNTVSFLAVTLAGTLVCAFVGLYFLSIETA